MQIKVFLNIECYPNYFLIYFKSFKTTTYFELGRGLPLPPLNQILKLMETYTTIGFNSNIYDLSMIAYFLQGASNFQLKQFSDELKTSKEGVWKICQKYKIHIPNSWNHINLKGVGPSEGVGLKMYGARLHTVKLQDLPLDYSVEVKNEDYITIREHCLNNITLIIELYESLKDRLDLRQLFGKETGLNLSSKSNAQLAESLLKTALGIPNIPSGSSPFLMEVILNKTYSYKAPQYLQFKSSILNDLKRDLELHIFKCTPSGKLASNFRRNFSLNDTPFSFGIGGLHSKEKKVSIIPKSSEFLLDVDVISYYPSLILNNSYYPESVGEKFLEVYGQFYKARLEAKKSQNKLRAETYKIILNDCFGKFGSPYSFLYSPSLLLHTTLTGQLSLLMLIEAIGSKGVQIVSTNTDGITILGPRTRLTEIEVVIDIWKEVTKLQLEYTFYRALYQGSVNSYVAILCDGTSKAKGIFGAPGLVKNPVNSICIEAITQYLQFRIPIPTTIYGMNPDVRKFIVVRKVTGGALYKGQYLGEVIRWYYGIEGEKIISRLNGAKVPDSDGAVPLMELPNHIPMDINFPFYIEKSYKLLESLGVTVK